MAVGYRTRGFGFEEPARPEEIREVFKEEVESAQAALSGL
jgi:hypothetical protein